jgi:lysozyme
MTGNKMEVSDKGLELTEELRRLQAQGLSRYWWCPWTIGYGHTGGVRENQMIDQPMAELLLKHDLDYAVGIVNSHACPVRLKGSLMRLSILYLTSDLAQFLNSHLHTYHVAGEYEKAAAEFPKWKYDNGRVIDGLVTRRQKERELYEA